MQQISSAELKARLDAGDTPVILDVREDWEYALCRLQDSVQISMSELPARLHKLNKDDEIVVVCHHGARSMQVATYLEAQGFAHISNLTGGIHDWAVNIDADMARY